MSDYLSGNSLREEIENPAVGQDAIVEGLIFKDTVNILYSEPGVGKSVIAVNMLAAMSGGWPVFGLITMKRFYKCSYLQLEGSRDEQFGRFHDIASVIPVDYENISWHTSPVFVESLQSQYQMFQELLQFKPEVIFIDSFYCLTSHGLSKEEGFLPVRNLLKQIKDKTNASLIILHHSAKPQYFEGQKVQKDDPFLGSQYMKAFADSMIECTRQGENKVILKVTKAQRNNEGLKQISLAFNKTNWVVTAISEGTTKDATTAIRECLAKCFRNEIEVTYDTLIQKTGFTKRHIRRLKNDGHFNHLCSFEGEEGTALKWLPKCQVNGR